jgi:hypothetical protein
MSEQLYGFSLDVAWKLTENPHGDRKPRARYRPHIPRKDYTWEDFDLYMAFHGDSIPDPSLTKKQLDEELDAIRKK